MRNLLAFGLVMLIPGVAAAQYGDPPPAYGASPAPGYASPPGYRAPASGGHVRRDHADDASAGQIQGFVLSFGLAYGSPFGDMVKSSSGTSTSMSDGISGQVPFMIGVGYRPHPVFSFGAKFEYAPLLTKNCDTGASCSASDKYLGIEARLHFAVEQSFSPWISAGLGYEWFDLSESGAYVADMGLNGLEFELQAGGDIRVSPVFTLGPFVGIRFGNYDSASVNIPGSMNASGDIADANQATHGWVAFGLRGAFTL